MSRLIARRDTWLAMPEESTGGLDPFHMVVRAFEGDLAQAMETAWSQATGDE
jgi:hypothetical protein